MAVTCPNCDADVSDSRVVLTVQGTTLPAYRCFNCGITFVLMPDDAKISTDDVGEYLRMRRSGNSKTYALWVLKIPPKE